jgi:lipopolysaccharide transport system ATP-binding protein
MSENAIIVENLSKKYVIGHRHSFSGQKHQYVALRDVIGRELRNFARKAADVARGRQVIQGDEIEQFWALKDVNFEVKQGRVLGIIGRNGAGKSTLLKVLSRITEPTKGRVLLTGRVASLLEVGTGFHPELTGRENVFLNGAVLGMTQWEIRKKFDEIVAFAEVEKFLDTPVKHYSSGMYVRLAFAVAAHLEPEILILDEILAVGDSQFQKKCLGKMGDVSKQGRTVLFVSHNLDAVRNFCNSIIILQEGQLVYGGAVESGVEHYLRTGTCQEATVTFERPQSGAPLFRSARLLNDAGEPGQTIDVRRGFSVALTYEIPDQMRNLEVAIRILTSDSRPVFTSVMSEALPEIFDRAQKGIRRATASIPGNFLMPGRYLITIALLEPGGVTFDVHEGVLEVAIEDSGTIFTKYNDNRSIGVVIKPLAWTCAAVG